MRSAATDADYRAAKDGREESLRTRRVVLQSALGTGWWTSRSIAAAGVAPSFWLAKRAAFARPDAGNAGEWRMEVLVQFGSEQIRLSSVVKIR